MARLGERSSASNGAVASARLRQITIIVAVESVIWRTEVGIASLIRAPVDSTSAK
jgi:hypothetical protein